MFVVRATAALASSFAFALRVIALAFVPVTGVVVLAGRFAVVVP